MNAKEMFEKLGYALEEDNNNPEFISYVTPSNSCLGGNEYILFDKKTQLIACYTLNDNSIEIRSLSICIKELQAINKQVEELGWLK